MIFLSVAQFRTISKEERRPLSNMTQQHSHLVRLSGKIGMRKNCHINLIFAQNMDYGYSLEPSECSGSNQ